MMGVRYPPAPMPRRKKGAGEEVDTSLDPVGITDLYSEERNQTTAIMHNVSTLAQKASAMPQQTIAQETESLARHFSRSKFEQGLSMEEMKALVHAYAKRGPDEKSALLHALDIHPGYMASYFTIVPHSPSLPESDPVFHILETNHSKTEEWQERNRKTAIGGIAVSDPPLLERAMITLGARNIFTLGDLVNTDPFSLLSTKHFGRKQLELCIKLLYKHRLMTPEWNEAALEIRRRNGSSTRGKHAPERGK